MTQHYARICWNEKGWKEPSGSASDSKNTFFGQFGFGLEEWLLDPSATIDGWQYGFLQPVNKGYKKRVGQSLSLRLYSIPGGGAVRYREEFAIPYCEVLTRDQAKEAHQIFKEAGRIERMIEQIKAVRGKPSPLVDGTTYFENIINVRFRLKDVEELPHHQPSFRADYYALYAIPASEIREHACAYPDEIEASEAFWEGASKRVTINAYERDSRARRECIAYWGCKCQVCGMSFDEQYGQFAKGMIHVHHIVPLATVGKRYKVNGKTDLIPVCPNCHSMLHWGENPPSVDELRKLVRRDK